MKKFKVETLIYIYIILLPILDSFSNMYREWFPSSGLSPAMFLRLIIPGILFLYIMIKDKESQRYLIIMGIVYLIYGFVHLYIFNNLTTEIAYGDFFKESTYIINYTFNVFMLYIMYYFYSKRRLPYLKDSLYISLLTTIVTIIAGVLNYLTYKLLNSLNAIYLRNIIFILTITIVSSLVVMIYKMITKNSKLKKDKLPWTPRQFVLCRNNDYSITISNIKNRNPVRKTIISFIFSGMPNSFSHNS